MKAFLASLLLSSLIALIAYGAFCLVSEPSQTAFTSAETRL